MHAIKTVAIEINAVQTIGAFGFKPKRWLGAVVLSLVVVIALSIRIEPIRIQPSLARTHRVMQRPHMRIERDDLFFLVEVNS
jgi:hypothetical protein